ncbi:MAG TPA: MFS transporter [Hanamia sp.]|nr:MFS transporter [Hanamia sp.]
MQISEVFRSLRSRNFALFFSGQLISRIGMWMQRTAVIWVVYTITDSVFMIGVATFAEQFPSFIFSVRGGIIADKYNRYKVLMLTQTLSAVQAVLLTVFTFSGNYNIPLILGLSVFLGIVNAYDVPVRQSMINEIVENKDDLANAIALNSSLNTLARLIGPALSGFVLAKYGADYCFLANAISFIAVIAAIAAMRFPGNTFVVSKTKSKGQFKEAITYLKENKPIATVIWIAALSSFFVMSYITLLPVYAKDIFKGNAVTYGWLNSAIGVGAFAGSFYLAALSNKANFRKVLLLNTFLLGVSLLLFAYSDNLLLSLIFSVIGGFSSICQMAVIITIVQRETDKEFRGRIISFIAMAMFGMLPLGSLLVGYLAPIAGAPLTSFVQGIIEVIIGIIFYKNLNGTFKLKQSYNEK